MLHFAYLTGAILGWLYVLGVVAWTMVATCRGVPFVLVLLQAPWWPGYAVIGIGLAVFSVTIGRID